MYYDTRFKPTIRDLDMLQGRWREHPRYRGCRLHWLFSEGAGNQVYDLSGRSHHGTMIGTPSWVSTAPYGWGLLFNGTTDAISIATPSLYGNQSDFTVTLSIFRSGSTATIFDWDSSGAGSSGITISEFTTGGRIEANLRENNAGDSEVSTGSVTTSQWFYLTLVFHDQDGATHAWVEYYFNGILDSIDDFDAATPSHIVPPVSENAYLGANEGTSAFFSGVISEFRVDDYALSSSEVMDRYLDRYVEFAWASQQLNAPYIVSQQQLSGSSSVNYYMRLAQ